MLLSSNLVRKIGYPDPRFFISGDYTIYGLLASKYTNLILVENAVLTKAFDYEDNSTSPMYIYYMIRNYHLFSEYFFKISNGKSLGIKTKVQLMLFAIKKIINFRDNNYNFKKYLKAVVFGFIDSIRKRVHSSHPLF